MADFDLDVSFLLSFGTKYDSNHFKIFNTMKTFYILATMLILSFTSTAQTSGELVIFSNTGEKFYVLMNGIYQNYEPEMNVRISELTDEWYSCKIISADNLFTIEKNVGVKKGFVTTYRIVEKSGVYKLRYYTESPMESYTAGVGQPAETMIVYHATETQQPVLTTTTQTTTTQTTTGNPSTGTDGSVSISMQVTDGGFSTDVSVSEGATTGTTTYSETTTVTTQTTEHVYTSPSTTQSTSSVNTSCLVDNTSFARVKSSIEAETFSDDKMRVAKQVCKTKCFTVNQIKELAGLFSFSEEILAFTKLAYPNCVNKEDYYEVMEVFTFSADKEALELFLDQQ